MLQGAIYIAGIILGVLGIKKLYNKYKRYQLAKRYQNANMEEKNEILEEVLREKYGDNADKMIASNEALLKLYNMSKDKKRENVSDDLVDKMEEILSKFKNLTSESSSQDEKNNLLMEMFNLLGEPSGASSAMDMLLSNSYEEDCFLMSFRSHDLIKLYWDLGDHKWIVGYYSISANAIVVHFSNLKKKSEN